MSSGLRSLLPKSVTRHLEERRLANRIAEFNSTILDDLPAAVKKESDTARIARLKEELKPAFEKEPTSAAKYADLDYWLLFNVERVARLGLHREGSKKILDIGCGPGYFVAATRALGHQSFGVDLPAEYFTAVERRTYAEMLASLRIEPYVNSLMIERFSPMDLVEDRFDLISAFWICFNRHRQPDEWGVKEWQFWVKDALDRLRDGGVVHLELNENPERYGDLRWYDRPSLEFFQSAGTVERNIVRIGKRP